MAGYTAITAGTAIPGRVRFSRCYRHGTDAQVRSVSFPGAEPYAGDDA
jgi:hypothetical protein